MGVVYAVRIALATNSFEARIRRLTQRLSEVVGTDFDLTRSIPPPEDVPSLFNRVFRARWIYLLIHGAWAAFCLSVFGGAWAGLWP